MIKRSQSGIVKPIDRLSLNTFLISPIPKNASDALKDPQWRNAMYDEYNVLVKNDTWLLVPRPTGSFGVDFDETFSPVVKPSTIHTVLSLAVSRKWPIHQLDVKNAFLNGDLSETVYMHQPPGFVDARQGSQFDMTDLGALNYFLGISAVRHSTGLFLSQRKYALQLFERAHMVNCNPSRTPVDTESKLGPYRVPVQDLTMYRSLAGGLQYLTFTRSDLSYAVQQICLYMHDLSLRLYVSSTTSLVGYTDVDWAGCPSTRSAEAKYRAVANVVAETTWLRNLLRELHSPLSTVTLVYCDNVSAVYMSVNPVQHQRTKHIEIDIHFVRDMVTWYQARKILKTPKTLTFITK
ncbi:ribonuclease H-like domain-containing protein [Tanacetum coccineum]